MGDGCRSNDRPPDEPYRPDYRRENHFTGALVRAATEGECEWRTSPAAAAIRQEDDGRRPALYPVNRHGQGESCQRCAAGTGNRSRGRAETDLANAMNQQNKPGSIPESGERIVGAVPEGASDEASAAAAVRDMFSSIAPRYDLLNHLLSMNVDRLWWNRTARSFETLLSRPDANVLDLCCGTGDMTFALHRRTSSSSTRIVGVDFSHPMLLRAGGKTRGRSIRWVEADALNLPFSAGQFDLVTAAFGFRNLSNYDRGLAEIYRVLAGDGEVGILDFGEPKGFIGAGYRIYFRHVLPAI